MPCVFIFRDVFNRVGDRRDAEQTDKRDGGGRVRGGQLGLGFGAEGTQPTGNATSAELAQYDAHYVGDPSGKVLYLTFDCGYENG